MSDMVLAGLYPMISAAFAPPAQPSDLAPWDGTVPPTVVFVLGMVVGQFLAVGAAGLGMVFGRTRYSRRRRAT